MRNSLLKNALLVAAFSGWTSTALAAGLTVTPNLVTNDYVGKITITVTGLAVGQAVLIEKYGDFNGNGAIDAGEPVLQGGVLIDGAQPFIGGVRNLNVPGDEDGAVDGQIRMELPYPGAEKGLDFFAAKYVIKVSNPVTHAVLATSPFEVKQKVFAQGVTGRLFRMDTGLPLANAMVVLLPPQSDPVTGAVTDANGYYTLYGAPGNYVVLPIATGYVGDFNGGITVNGGALATLNLTLPAATRTISGKLKDSASGMGIPGVMVQAESSSGQWVSGFSQSDGTYSLGVLQSSWELEPSSSGLAILGYLGWNNGTNVSTVSGHVANFDLPVDQATALIYGTVKNSQNNPVVGIGIDSNDQPSRQYSTSGTTAPPNADYCVGVRPGSWWVGPDSDTLSLLGYIGPGTNVTLTLNQALRVDFVLTQANAHLIGRVVDDTGAPVANISFNASNHQGVDNNVDTDGNGNFDIGVSAGTWYLQISTDDARQRQLISPQVEITLANGETRNNIVVIAQRATAQISGAVRTSSASPIAGLWVWSHTTVNGTNYNDGIQTDASGNYHLNAFNGTWQVSLDSNGLQSRGYFDPGSVQTNVAGANVTVDFVVNQPAAHLRGRLVDNTGAGVGNAQFGAYNASQSLWMWTQTATDGSFDLGVQAGSWSLNLSSNDAQARGLMGPNLSAFNVVNGVDQNNILVVAQRTTAQIIGHVQDNSANPIVNLGVWSSITVNGTNYVGYTWTDASGNYQFSVFNGSWQVGLNCGGNQSLESYGYLCVDPVQTTVAGANATVNFVVQPAAALQITTTSLPNGAVGSSYSAQLNASGGTQPYEWSLALGGLPAGLTLNPATGLIDGAPSTSGTFNFTVRATDAASATATQPLSISISSLPPVVAKWSRALNGGPVYYSSPAIGSDGTIYIGSGAPFNGAPTRGLYAVNPDGTLKWQYTSADMLNMYTPSVGGDGTIYVQDSLCSLHAINPDGTLKWKHPFSSYIEVGQTAPAIASDGTIYVGADTLYAINPDGTQKWRNAHTGMSSPIIRSSPAIAADGTVYVGINGLFGEIGVSFGNALLALNSDGSFKWEYILQGADWVFSSPALGADGTIFIGAETSTGGDLAFVYAVNSNGTLKWRYDVTGGRTIRSSPAVGSDGTVYIGTKAGAATNAEFLALHPNGTLKWTYAIDTAGADIYCSPAIGADGIIYFGAETGFLYALNPNGSLAWKFSSNNGINWTSPAIAPDGTIYFGNNDGTLFALTSSSLGLADSPWPKFRHDNRNTGTLTRPRLSILCSEAGSVSVSWPLPAEGYVLEQTSQLLSPPQTTVWTPVGISCVTNPPEVRATMPLAPGRCFFRLRKP